MSAFLTRTKAFIRNEQGPTATEYAMLLALIVVIAIGAIMATGTRVSAVFNNIASAMPTGGGGS